MNRMHLCSFGNQQQDTVSGGLNLWLTNHPVFLNQPHLFTLYTHPRDISEGKKEPVTKRQGHPVYRL